MTDVAKSLLALGMPIEQIAQIADKVTSTRIDGTFTN